MFDFGGTGEEANLYKGNKYISSREFKTSEFSPLLCTRVKSDVFNTLDDNNW